jgi:solute:Na+ symporter, SSS family
MTTPLAVPDLVVIALYVGGTVVLGPWFARGQRDVRTYFLGGRAVGWVLVLVSIVATETSVVSFLSVPGLAFHRDGGNLTYLQLAFGYVVGRAVIAWLLLPLYFGGEFFTAYQVLRQRFSPAVQRTASALFLATRTVADGLRLYLTALFLQQITGWGETASALVVGLTTLAYTYLGGMQAVIWTDVIQFAIKIAGAAVAGVLILTLLPGGVQEYVATGEAAGKFRVFDFAPDLTLPFTFWAGLVGGAFLTMASHGADQMMVQRYLCARSLGGARAALALSGVVVLFQFLLFLLVGVGLYALYRAGGLPVAEGTRDDQVFGLFMVHNLPRVMPGLLGLVVAAVLAAAMSTLSSSLNSSANAALTDFYKPLRPGRTEAEYLLDSKLLTAFWGAAQIAVALVALAAGDIGSVVEKVLKVAGLTTGTVLGLFALGALRRPVRSPAALAGLVIGFATVLSVSALTTLAWPWYALVGTLTTVAAGLLAERLLPAPQATKKV